MSDASLVRETALRAREAAVTLAVTPRRAKDAALLAMADAPGAHSAAILAANAEDVDRRARGRHLASRWSTG